MTSYIYPKSFKTQLKCLHLSEVFIESFWLKCCLFQALFLKHLQNFLCIFISVAVLKPELPFRLNILGVYLALEN